MNAHLSDSSGKLQLLPFITNNYCVLIEAIGCSIEPVD
jgi:hypothetical protein